jgi:hypothetical protein
MRQALLITAAVAAALAATAGAAVSPTALAAALARAKVSAAQLPHGYKLPVVSTYKLTAGDKKHGAVGGTTIVLDHGAEVVIYIVFKTQAEAQADFAHAKYGTTSHRPAPATVPKPNVEIDTSTSGKVGLNNVTIGLTDIAFPYKNVLIQAGTSSETSRKHGDVAGAVALAHFAVQHVDAVS